MHILPSEIRFYCKFTQEALCLQLCSHSGIFGFQAWKGYTLELDQYPILYSPASISVSPKKMYLDGLTTIHSEKFLLSGVGPVTLPPLCLTLYASVWPGTATPYSGVPEALHFVPARGVIAHLCDSGIARVRTLLGLSSFI